MLGILKIAYKLLENDRTKFAALLIGAYGFLKLTIYAESCRISSRVSE
jgi:hypothetical protein